MDYAVHGILQARVFPTQGLNPGLPHSGQILYQPSHKGSHTEWDGVQFGSSGSRILGKLSASQWALLDSKVTGVCRMTMGVVLQPGTVPASQ